MKPNQLMIQMTFLCAAGMSLLLLSPIRLNADPPPANLAWKRNPIEVFANLTSVRQGDPISFYVATGESLRNNAVYRMRVYRVGVTDSFIVDLGSSFVLQYQPLHDSLGNALPSNSYIGKPFPREFKTGCVGSPANWSIAYTIPGTTTSGWKSGFYYVKCSLVSDSTIFRRAPFVVKEDNPGSTSNILYKVPFNTYHAYNAWGGSNLYSDGEPLVQSNDTVSFLRPMGDRPDHLERTDIGSFDLAERHFIQWAEGAGYAMEYCTNVDLDEDGVPSNPNRYGFIAKYKFIVTSGHDEYWSAFERNAVEDGFIPNQSNSGGNAAFLSGNISYWKAAYNNTRTRIAVGKHTSSGTYIEDSLWRSSAIGKPEAKFIGIQVTTAPPFEYVGEQDIVQLPTHWLFKGIVPPFNLGDQFGTGFSENAAGAGIVGGEVDKRHTSSPANAEVISSNSFSNGQVHEAVFYINTQSNARVFGAGSIYWSRGLYGSIPSDRDKFRTIMTNLMDHFSEKKFVGNIYIPITWRKNIELDGHVYVLSGVTLTLENNMTLTIDAGDTLFVDGTLEITDGVRISGSGVVKYNASGKLKLTTTVQDNWNMVSVPDTVADFSKAAVYPTASSAAFSYSGTSGYQVQTSL
ncbi:MAG: hypothetical protein HY277_07165, partial [Ignavibacteriales bacterium]|nr:hypothetical protein [Ignavibacteriales bacterium]